MRTPEPGTQAWPEGRGFAIRKDAAVKIKVTGEDCRWSRGGGGHLSRLWLGPKQGQLRQWQASDGLATPQCSPEGAGTPT